MLRCLRGSLACALLVLAGLWGTGAMAAAPATPTHYRIVGYDTGSAGTPKIDASKIDVIIFAFARVDHGKVVLPEKAVTRLRNLIALKKTHPALKVTISVGGWEAGGFSEAAATPAGRRLFAQTAADMVVKQHADGLDVDWEYPGSSQSGIASSPQDRAHFTQLLKLLRATLDKAGAANGHVGANHYLLTIASADSQYVHGIDLAAVAPYLDWFNVMTYDFNNSLTPLTGHHSGLFAARMAPAAARTTARAVHQYLADGVPADKIVIGAAFYGRRFDGVKPVDNGRYQPYASSTHMYGWKKLKADFINKQGYRRYWDKYADAPYLWNAATRSFISYDDPQSLAAKAAFVKANHLGGIMYWEATEDDHNQLLDAIWQGLKR